MLTEGHIFTIKTKDPQNVEDIQNTSTGVVISGLNVLKDKIRINDLVFVVFGGDHPSWETGLVGLAQISRSPFDEGYDGRRNFRVVIDIKAYFAPIVRADLVTYPDTFDIIGIAPITKWEPNQAITAVEKTKAIALLQAICDLRPDARGVVEGLLGAEFSEIPTSVNRYRLAKSVLGQPETIENLPLGHSASGQNYQNEFITWWSKVAKRAEKTARNYLGYLACLNKPLGEKTHSTWPGIFIYLFGRKSEREVVEVGTLTEFDKIFGPFCQIFDKSGCPEGADQKAYEECVQWVEDVSEWSCLSSAFKAYREFLLWREKQTPPGKLLPANEDRLTVALKMYATVRGSMRLTNWASYDAWTHGTREEFAEVNEGLLEEAGFDYVAYIRKYAISTYVANTFFSGHTEAEKRAVLRFLREQKESPKAVSWYLDEGHRLMADGAPVAGLKPMTVLYFLSELHPAEFAAWTGPTYETLAFLGLHKGEIPRELTLATYEDCKSKQQRIVERMRALGIGKASDDGSAADYRTVNEFLWWVKDNRDDIQEEAMKRQMKDEKPVKYAGPRKALAFASENKEDELLLRLLAALRAKPFVILAGHSGTGKSRYAKKLAYMTCNAEELRTEGQLPGNYLLLQVRPNWHDSTDLLGYRNAMDGNRQQKTALVEFLFKAMHYRETPFFLCLDEMNLAPVEQYFAEFLSAMESKEPVPLNDVTAAEDNLVELGCEWVDAKEALERRGFAIPENLFIVGTVNMDETTNQFSRKVLDRAFTIEMTDVDFRNFGKVEEPGYGDTLEEETIQALLDGRGEVVQTLDGEDTADGAALVRVQKALEDTAFAIAYRFASEYTLLKRAIAVFDPEGRMGLDALDQAVLMKILPRVAGERDYIERVYGKGENEGLRKALEGKAVSLAKIGSILKRAVDTDAQYMTFWP